MLRSLPRLALVAACALAPLAPGFAQRPGVAQGESFDELHAEYEDALRRARKTPGEPVVRVARQFHPRFDRLARERDPRARLWCLVHHDRIEPLPRRSLMKKLGETLDLLEAGHTEPWLEPLAEFLVAQAGEGDTQFGAHVALALLRRLAAPPHHPEVRALATVVRGELHVLRGETHEAYEAALSVLADFEGTRACKRGSTLFSATRRGRFEGVETTGRVVYSAPVPKQEMFDPKDLRTPNCAASDLTDLTNRGLRVGAAGGLRDVAVVLTPLDGTAEAHDRQEHFLRIEHMRFEPHLLVVPTGDPLALFNLSDHRHNVHLYAVRNGGHNFTLAEGERRTLTFERPEMLTIQDDLHPWMMAHVLVTDTPYTAVTDRSGRFRIDAPEGRYKMTFHHPQLGRARQEILVHGLGTTTLGDLPFPPR